MELFQDQGQLTHKQHRLPAINDDCFPISFPLTPVLDVLEPRKAQSSRSELRTSAPHPHPKMHTHSLSSSGEGLDHMESGSILKHLQRREF